MFKGNKMLYIVLVVEETHVVSQCNGENAEVLKIFDDDKYLRTPDNRFDSSLSINSCMLILHTAFVGESDFVLYPTSDLIVQKDQCNQRNRLRSDLLAGMERGKKERKLLRT